VQGRTIPRLPRRRAMAITERPTAKFKKFFAIGH
jgi:hypothetical protein